MKYKIKIENAFEEDGSIDLKRLSMLSSAILSIAEGSLQIRLTGTSFSRGRKASYLNDALKVKITGIKKGSTVLELECDTFKKSLKDFQPDLFNENIYAGLQTETPVSLVVNTFKDALDDVKSKDFLDKSLLKELKKFNDVLASPDEKIRIINQGSFRQLTLEKKDFDKIEILEQSTPEPKQVILNGKLDVLEHTKTRVKIITKEGVVEAFLTANVKPEDIRSFWGEEVTISGMANYKPDGKISFIEINNVFKPGKGDSYFSIKPDTETTEQQIERQLKERGYKNRLGEIVGKWPGDEDINSLLELLKK